MNMKILSPAGEMESLKMAVFNGADEVYLGVKGFNARNIEGFDLETLKQAVDFAHVYGVRVFLTVNILFTNYEIQDALDLIVDAYNLGVDAFIIQDIGLASLMQKYYPQIEIHASTQMGIHNLEGVKFVEGLGFKRVVLARETPLEEIKRIRDNSNIEIEYFVHGALCVSFSGNCYLSSYLFDASGNRGKCKQLCRLPYRLKYEDEVLKYGYLLSAKDFNMLDKLEDLEKAGVNSLKIEGRARRPYYVGTATKMYADAIKLKDIEENKKAKQSNREDIRLAFNRGYTQGYFNGNSGIISYIQNHTGVAVGKVEKFKKGNKFNEIYISSDRELSEKSTFKFFREKEEIATISAYDLQKKGEFYRITTKQVVEVGDKVNLIVDYSKEQYMLQTKAKRSIALSVKIIENEPMFAKVNIDGKDLEVYGDVAFVAKTAPITKEEVEDNFYKDEYFVPDLSLEIGNVFVPKSKLNAFRRKVYSDIYALLTKVENTEIEKIRIEPDNSKVRELENVQFISSLDEDFDAEIIVLDPEIYSEETINLFVEKCEKVKSKAVLNLPNFALTQDIVMLKNLVEKTKIAVMVNNVYGLSFDTEKYIGGGVNIYNDYSAKYLNLPYIKAENSKYKMPYMTFRHCPMKEHLNANCSNCPYKEGYYYKMEGGQIFNLKRKKLSTCTFYLTD